MAADSRRGNAQLECDLLCRVPVGQQFEHLPLPFAEPELRPACEHDRSLHNRRGSLR